MPSSGIVSLRDFAHRLGVPLHRLREVSEDLKTHSGAHYRFRSLRKGDKVRHIRPPRKELKSLQRRIVDRIFKPLGFGDHAHGSVPGRSPQSNAGVHVGQARLVTMDVKGFFDSVQHRRMYRMLRDQHRFGHDVARLLTRLVTLRGSLPQGAPTSPGAANLFALSIDQALASYSEEHGLRYSRFVDDFALSGPVPLQAVSRTAKLLSAKGLKLNRRKIHVTDRTSPQAVTGLLVNAGAKLSIPRNRRDAVRAAIFQFKGSPLTGDAAKKVRRSIEGKIRHIEQYHPGAARRLWRSLAEALAERESRSG